MHVEKHKPINFFNLWAYIFVCFIYYLTKVTEPIYDLSDFLKSINSTLYTYTSGNNGFPP